MERVYPNYPIYFPQKKTTGWVKILTVPESHIHLCLPVGISHTETTTSITLMLDFTMLYSALACYITHKIPLKHSQKKWVDTLLLKPLLFLGEGTEDDSNWRAIFSHKQRRKLQKWDKKKMKTDYSETGTELMRGRWKRSKTELEIIFFKGGGSKGRRIKKEKKRKGHSSNWYLSQLEKWPVR